MRVMRQSPAESDDPSFRGPRYHPLVLVLIAVALGILADRRLGLPLAFWWPAAVGAWLVWLAAWRRRLDRVGAVALGISLAACGASWHHARWHLFPADEVGLFARRSERPVCVEAVVLSGPRRLFPPAPSPMRIIPVGERTRLDVRLAALRNGSDWEPVSGRSRLTVDGHLLGVHAGDRLRVFAQLVATRAAENPGQFDSAEFARGERRLCQLRAEVPECVDLLERASWWNAGRFIERLRERADRILWGRLRPGESGLAAAVLLGAREEVEPEQAEAIMQTGMAHLLVVAGLHVGIVAFVAMLLLRLLPLGRAWTAALLCLSVMFYALVAHAEPPTVRAVILVVIASTAYALGRRATGVNGLAAAGLVVLAMNPAALFHTGVQLSFLCVAGLMWFAPRVGASPGHPTAARDRVLRLLRRNQSWPRRVLGWTGRWIGRCVLVSFLLWLLTVPLVMARFHMLSPVAPLLGAVLWLPMSLAMAAGLGVLALGWLAAPLATPLVWLCDSMFWLIQALVNGARHIPGSHYWVPGPADWWLAGLYAALALAAAVPQFRPPRRWCLALVCGWIGLGLGIHWLQRGRERLDCTFLSVDHGCAAVIECPSGAVILYDAGQFSSPEAGTDAAAHYLWSRGIARIDAVVLSHPDADHYNALPGLLERFPVGAVYVPPLMFDQQGAAIQGLRRAIEHARVPIRQISANDRIQGTGPHSTFQVLHPPQGGVIASDNANSVVLAVEYQGHRLLLPGDLEPPGVDDVAAEEPWHCDVLLAPHHGSRRSKAEVLVKWCSPEWVVISGGRHRGMEEGVALFASLGAKVLHTGQSGAIRARFDREGISLTPLTSHD
jgi:competence protein ComEC